MLREEVVCAIVIVVVGESRISRPCAAFVIHLLILFVIGITYDLHLTGAYEDALSRRGVEVTLSLYAAVILAACCAWVEGDADPQSGCEGSLAHKEDCSRADPRHGYA